MVNEIINGLGVLVPVVIVGAGGIGIVGSGYVKASPDKAYIICIVYNKKDSSYK